MKNPSTLLAGLFAGAAAGLALLGLLTLDALSAVSFKQSFMLPQLISAGDLRDLLLSDRHPAPVVSVLLAAHAALVLLAVALAAIVTARAKDQPWAPRLALGLGGASFYVAHFCFVHPGGPLTAANLGVRALDYVAVLALALGVSSLVHFSLLFPRKFDAGAFSAFVRRNADQQRASLAASRLPWRRRRASPQRTPADEKATALQLRWWQWTQSITNLLVMVAVGWLLLALLPIASTLSGPVAIAAAVLCALAGFAALILGFLAAVFAGSVLEWHHREGEPAVRRGVAVILRSYLVTFWIFAGLGWAAIAWVFFARNVSGAELFLLVFTVGGPVIALAVIASTGIATWRMAELPPASG